MLTGHNSLVRRTSCMIPQPQGWGQEVQVHHVSRMQKARNIWWISLMTTSMKKCTINFPGSRKVDTHFIILAFYTIRRLALTFFSPFPMQNQPRSFTPYMKPGLLWLEEIFRIFHLIRGLAQWLWNDPRSGSIGIYPRRAVRRALVRVGKTLDPILASCRTIGLLCNIYYYKWCYRKHKWCYRKQKQNKTLNVVQPHWQDIDDPIILFPKPEARPYGLKWYLPLFCLPQHLSFTSGHSPCSSWWLLLSWVSGLFPLPGGCIHCALGCLLPHQAMKQSINFANRGASSLLGPRPWLVWTNISHK